MRRMREGRWGNECIVATKNRADHTGTGSVGPPHLCHCEERTDAASALATKQSPGHPLMNRQYYVYLMTNARNSVIYTGVTNDLNRRVYEHKSGLAGGFTVRYNVTKLVYYEVFQNIEDAILREKQIKAGSRERKVRLVDSTNERWRDLYGEL